MADTTLAGLPAASALDGTESLYALQGGADKEASVSQVKDYVQSAVPVHMTVAASDETTALTTGTAKVTFRAPFAMTLTGVRLSVGTAPTGAALIVDVNDGGTSVFSTRPQIDAGSKTSVGSAVTPVFSDTALADDAEITIDIDQVGSTVAGAGLKVTLIGTRT